MLVSDYKEIIAGIAVVLTFVGYVPYFRDILAGTTKPHLYSWLVWCVTTGIVIALQITAGAGPSVWVTCSVWAMLLVVFFMRFKYGYKERRLIDMIFLVAALLIIPLWLFAKQPVLAIVLLCTIEMLGFAPTIRKAWSHPYSETVSMFAITFFRHILALLALSNWNIVAYLFPLTWVVANGGFAILLVVRRKLITNKYTNHE